jgi:hypothetical protein
MSNSIELIKNTIASLISPSKKQTNKPLCAKNWDSITSGESPASTPIKSILRDPKSTKIKTTKRVTFKEVVKNPIKQTSKLENENNVVKTFTSKFLSCINISSPSKALVLFDSGAINANVVSKKYVDNLRNDNKKINIEKDTRTVYAVDGKTKLINHGRCYLTLIFEELTLPPTEFLVVEKMGSYDIIIGLPAFRQHRISLNIPDGTVQILENSFRLNRENSYQ